MYLNRISIAGGKHGISSAAEQLFGKDISKVGIAEAAIMAGMLKSPARYNPSANPDAAYGRMRLVLAQMLEQGYIDAGQYAYAAAYRHAPPPGGTGGQTRYFIDYAMSEFASAAGGIERDVEVRTTLDLPLQKTLEGIVRDFVGKEGRRYRFSQAAAVFINDQGEILAMVGGADYAASQFNRAVQMKRQPGSLFKPFVYLAGLERGMKPSDMFVDEPTGIGGWIPKNHDGRYYGPISMARALALSVNTVPVAIAREIGVGPIIDISRRFGLSDPETRDYTIILGSGGASLLDLAAAYAMFANGGIGVMPSAVSSISSLDGRVIFARGGSGVGRLVSAENANAMDEMLRGAVREGTAAAAAVPGADVRGKTGTSQNNRDAWFAGYAGGIAGAVWIGNDDNSEMSKDSYGGLIPARIFKAAVSYWTARDLKQDR
jgi:penicillin-binding protein 1A